jgi:hypothetical protein
MTPSTPAAKPDAELIAVPVKPTADMIAAGQTMLPDDMPVADAVYAMMVGAAPKGEAGGVGAPVPCKSHGCHPDDPHCNWPNCATPAPARTAPGQVERVARALQTLADAADVVGVRFFDTDTMEPEVEAMQTATQEARAALAAHRGQ